MKNLLVEVSSRIGRYDRNKKVLGVIEMQDTPNREEYIFFNGKYYGIVDITYCIDDNDLNQSFNILMVQEYSESDAEEIKKLLDSQVFVE